MRKLSFADFSLRSCQATAFTPGHQLAAGRFMRDLLPLWARRFDAEPLIAASPEGPRIALLSSSSMWRCELAGPRINLYWVRPETAAPQIELADFHAAAGPFLSEYLELFQLRVGRLAAVVRRAARHETPALFLSRHFCRDEWQDTALEAAQSFELHVHRRIPLGGRFLVNARLRSATGNATGVASPNLIEVEQDLNTLADETTSRSFKPAELADFFTEATREIDRSLEASYPRVGVLG